MLLTKIYAILYGFKLIFFYLSHKKTFSFEDCKSSLHKYVLSMVYSVGVCLCIIYFLCECFRYMKRVPFPKLLYEKKNMNEFAIIITPFANISVDLIKKNTKKKTQFQHLAVLS